MLTSGPEPSAAARERALGAALLLGWSIGPGLAVFLWGKWLEHASSSSWLSWRYPLLGTVLCVGALLVGLALGAVAARRWQGRWSAGTLLGLTLSVFLPSLVLGWHEFLYEFEDWPCSSLNHHLGIRTWLRVLAMCLGAGLLARAGPSWIRGRGRRLAVALSAGALLVEVPASYRVTRSGCDGRFLQELTMFGPLEDVDPGCAIEVANCYCGVAYDPLGRPSLLRKGAPPARLWVPAWLLQGGRSSVESLLLYEHYLAPLPPGACRG